MMVNQTGVERASKGNGIAFPWQVRVAGELLRSSQGTARRFMTEQAARRALDRELRRRSIAIK